VLVNVYIRDVCVDYSGVNIHALADFKLLTQGH
jgi:hypothetical protein